MGVEYGPVVRCDTDECRAALPLAAGEDAFSIVSAEEGWMWCRSFGYLCPDHSQAGYQARHTASPTTSSR